MLAYQTNRTTIAAVVTAAGNAGVSVIRLSGPQSWDMIQQAFWAGNSKSFPKKMEAGRFYHGFFHQHQYVMDEVLILVFKAPNSFTGEDVIEIHCHGGHLLTQSILEACFELGAFPAQAGEFSFRAFMNGKLDLTQAESIMDLVHAQNKRLIEMAANNLGHRSLGQYIEIMIQGLLKIQAQIVASVDFPDEVDEPERDPLLEEIRSIEEHALTLKQSSQSHRFSREGLKVALLGLPNAGKSSLFNCLIASERAIVTHIAGTTRDLISETLWIDGVGLTLMDTAGIHHSEHEVEQLGIERSWQAAKEADCLLFLVDATRFGASGTLPREEANLMNALDENQSFLNQKPFLKLATKTDVLTSEALSSLPKDFLPISVQNNSGIMTLFEWLKKQTIQNNAGHDSLLAISLNHRQQACLDSAIENLAEAKSTLSQTHCPIDLTTVPLTACMKKLDELLGRDTTEEMLTEVFKQFCVGK